MSAALTRRRALAGSALAALGLGAGVALASPALSANDRRLVAIADAYEALDRRCNEHAIAHKDLSGKAARAADCAFDEITSGFGPLEQEMAETPADSMAGVLAKARLCQSPTARGCADFDHIASVADDLWRLFGGGAHA